MRRDPPRRGRLRPQGGHHLGRASATTSATRACRSTSRSSPTTSGRSRRCSRGHIDIAWNTPLAHVRVQRRTEGRSRSLGMRDSRSRLSRQDGRAQATPGIRTLADLAGQDARGRQPRLDAGAHPAAALPASRRASTSARVELLAVRHRSRQARRHRHAASSRCWPRSPTGARRRARSAIWSGSTSRRRGASIRQRVEVLVDDAAASITACSTRCPSLRREQRRGVPARAVRDAAGTSRRTGGSSSSRGCEQWMPPREEGYESLRARARRASSGW